MSRFAYLFPGQGAQRVGMGRSLHDRYVEARQVFGRASEILAQDVARLCFEGPDELLRDTQNAQIATFVTSVATLRSMEARVPQAPSAVAGHSVGEYAALVAARCVSFDDGLKLVQARGEFMREASLRVPGTMAAVLGLDAAAVQGACEQARDSGAGIVGVANYNGGGQTVISGEVNAVARASEIARAAGARRVVPLNVSGAFHSALMGEAGDKLCKRLMTIDLAKPSIPVVANVTARYVERPDDLVGGLTRQVSASVRWEESMRLLVGDGIATFAELGAGDVLTGLMRRIDSSARCVSVQDSDSLEAARALVTGSAGRRPEGTPG